MTYQEALQAFNEANAKLATVKSALAGDPSNIDLKAALTHARQSYAASAITLGQAKATAGFDRNALRDEKRIQAREANKRAKFRDDLVWLMGKRQEMIELMPNSPNVHIDMRKDIAKIQKQIAMVDSGVPLEDIKKEETMAAQKKLKGHPWHTDENMDWVKNPHYDPTFDDHPEYEYNEYGEHIK